MHAGHICHTQVLSLQAHLSPSQATRLGLILPPSSFLTESVSGRHKGNAGYRKNTSVEKYCSEVINYIYILNML